MFYAHSKLTYMIMREKDSKDGVIIDK